VRIHKFTHSCIYIEDDDVSILFDPGSYTAKEKSLDIDNLPSLDYILITHEHADHFDIHLIKKILDKFPDAKIITNHSVKKLLSNERIHSSTTQADFMWISNHKHEKVLGPDVMNWGFNIKNKIFNPGDSYEFDKSQTSEILLLPIQAPWGHMVQAVEKALSVKPRYVIPVHDWHWREEARQALYEQAESVLGKEDITFIKDIEKVPFEYK